MGHLERLHEAQPKHGAQYPSVAAEMEMLSMTSQLPEPTAAEDHPKRLSIMPDALSTTAATGDAGVDRH